MEKLKRVSDPPRGPVAVLVLDGIGIGQHDEGDAVFHARTPVLDRLAATCPGTSLRAHGTAVGLPSDEDMGNSEVGHNALGAGRVFDQGAKLVNKAIETGAVFRGPVFRRIVERCRGGGAFHLVGLLSDGNVHSHVDQLFAIVRRAAEEGVERLFVHPLLDGRDVPEKSALEYLEPLEELLASIRRERGHRYLVASGGGRMRVTMDRYEADWSIVERGWRAHVLGEARSFSSAREAVETFRREDPSASDQFLDAFVVVDEDGPVGPILDGDAVVFWNFRGDRAVEISRAFEGGEEFDSFDRVRVPEVLFAGMMQYDGDLGLPASYLVEPPQIDRTLGAYLSLTRLRQLAAAETQKYGHVTYFWSGNNTGLFDPETMRYVDVPAIRREAETYVALERSTAFETQIEVTSDRVPFEQRPWMKAAEVTDAVLDILRRDRYDFVRLNYANGDMVGHSGDLRAAVMAVEAVDLCLGRLLAELERQGGVAFVTADHGNADQMFELDRKTGKPKTDGEGKPRRRTSHSLNPVPFYVFDPTGAGRFALEPVEAPGLVNVAATVLVALGLEVPEGYEPPLVRRVT